MSWITTTSGRHLDFINPEPNQICIEDIASGLSNIPRWGGQLIRFYSVAEHCILMDDAYCVREGNKANPEIRKAIFLHDATEAFMGDIPRPLKVLLPDYKSIERKLDIIIKLMFGISTDPSIQEVVHKFDEMALKNEAIVRGGDINWSSDKRYKEVEILPFFRLYYLSPTMAKTCFLAKWKEVSDV